MILSKRCLHGLRAVLYLTLQPEGRGYVPISEIARELKIPFHFLTKILKDLGDEGLVGSARGASGGVKLEVPAGELTVQAVIESIEGTDFFTGCILGFHQCSESSPCALHDRWLRVRTEIERMFAGERMDTLAERIREEDLRLFEGA